METEYASAVRVPESTLQRYRRFSLYNSPYPAHDRGCAIDLYPATNDGVSPVAGEVLETRTVRAPSKPYAHDEEYLILVDVDRERSGLGSAAATKSESGRDHLVARILHVQPRVSAGDRVAVGDSLGQMVRSGFFAPWVANHVHLGFRRSEQHLHRAGGSLPVVPDVEAVPVPWDGVGTVVETGTTYARLDAPDHPAPDDRFAGIAGQRTPDSGGDNSDEATPATDERTVLDGGFTHYAGGGVLTPGTGTNETADSDTTETLSFLDHPVGDVSGRNVAWRDVDVLANGDRITGLSLFVGVGPEFGAKLVCPDREFREGQQVRVTIRDSDDPIRLG
ncbi:hypothetical protein [Halobellus ordinarius]|uniref:hypothetical protein n=1 Tax=Halobellus ordinarius TaxID=3075120 RepID=UPI0028803341|nr:hypothetical protein [Halobellus sp. ZY16]